MLDMTAQMIWSGEALPTDGADVRLVNGPVMGTHMVGHAILPLEPLLTDGTLEGLLVRVRQLVAVEVVHVSEGLPAHVTAVVLLHWFGRLFRNTLLLLVMHAGHDARAYRHRWRSCSQGTSYSCNV